MVASLLAVDPAARISLTAIQDLPWGRAASEGAGGGGGRQLRFDTAATSTGRSASVRPPPVSPPGCMLTSLSAALN